MARPLRIEYEGALYWVHAESNDVLVSDDSDSALFLDTVREMGDRFEVVLFAYVLLPRRYDLLVQTRKANLSRAMQWMTTAFTRRHNRLSRRKGPLFPKRFNSVLIENEVYLRRLSFHVHALPVKTGLCRAPRKYAWSSYPAYIGAVKGPPWLETGLILSAGSAEGSHKEYRQAFQEDLRKGDRTPDPSSSGSVLGSTRFVEKALLDASRNRKGARSFPPEGDERTRALKEEVRRVASAFRVRHDLLVSPSRRRTRTRDLRDALILHLYLEGRYTNREIARAFELTDSAVSHLVRSLKERVEQDEELRQRLEDMKGEGSSFFSLDAEETGPRARSVEEQIAEHIGLSDEDADMRARARGLHQAEKSRLMRGRLILATLLCLDEYGYNGATMSRILARAGVSSGAWRHHFENKKDLVAAAATAMYEGTIRKTATVLPALAEAEDPVTALLEFIHQSFHEGWHRNVWLEFTIASRTDAELRQHLVPVIEKSFSAMDEFAQRQFEALAPERASVEMLSNLTLYISRGMAIQSIIHLDDEHFQSLRDLWASLLTPLMRIKDRHE